MGSRLGGLLAAVLAGAGCAGCTGHARINLAAADALDALAGELSGALAEYRADLEHADDARESAVIAAFVERARRDGADDGLMRAHALQFAQALARVRDDRAAAWERHSAAQDNLAVTRELARDLRGAALAGLALQQDAQQYLMQALAAPPVREVGAAQGAQGADQPLETMLFKQIGGKP